MRAPDHWSSGSSSSSSPSPPMPNNRQLPNVDQGENSSNNGETSRVFRDVFKGRKCWKTQKGGEMVWPPELEAALLEGLAKYQPDNSRETVLLGRYPMRNRFISEYILRATGKYRTAKQVGSRLQQLRDTCNAKELQHLLSPVRKQNAPISNRVQYSCLKRYGLSDASPSLSDASLPGSPNIQANESAPRPLRPVIYTYDIVPEDHPSTMGSGASNYLSATSRGTSEAAASPVPIRAVDPTLTFTSASALPTSEIRSVFRVYQNDQHPEKVWKSDISALNPLDHSQIPYAVPDSTYMYKTSFSGGLWDAICQSEDPTKLTVYHNILRDNPNSSTPFVLFSAVYKFRYSYPPSHSNLRASAQGNGLGTLYSMETNSETSVQPTVNQDYPQNLDFFDQMLSSYAGYDFSNHDGWSGSVPTTPSGSEENYNRTSPPYYRDNPERFSHCRAGYRDDSSDSLSPVSTTFPATYMNYRTN
ncbi:hypothetical protein D9758_008798 [Tetrapyrgos nigripes]|uniref:TEA domain-containing protein n=1 Tax=Tetrapyrgos nigripes TaxID=182062 RepID=A0A8H5FXY2_9AGAR|nr:hypothetical protein D9758_008798 [Tetrapyrgos nigripes]